MEHLLALVAGRRGRRAANAAADCVVELHLAERRAVLPDIDELVGGDDDVRCGHLHKHGLDVDLLCLDRAADRVAQNEGGHGLGLAHAAVLVVDAEAVGDQDAVLAGAAHKVQLLEIFHLALVGLCVPEHNAVLALFWPREGIDEHIVEVGPEIVRAHVGKVDEAVDGERETQARAFPAERGDGVSGHLEGAQMVAKGCVELDHAELLAGLLGPGRARARDRKHAAVWVPADFERGHARVDQHGSVVALVAHDLDAAVVEGNCKGWGIGVHGALWVCKPLDPGDQHPSAAVGNAVVVHLRNEAAACVEEMDLAGEGCKDNVAARGVPAAVAEMVLEILVPDLLALDGAHHDLAVLVRDADLGAVGRPAHVAHIALVAGVAHLLLPHALVHHPHIDESIFV
eukprot:comp24152_c0_seq1/m.59877 comp24152_c0_seq1/g.59877  ORF comp24152_c0_seq1/g.59877 comp24152_c0_seq1/m.59877 type:complete len:400 (-) comp24152_c0_seq1:291-1490(-)